MVSVIVKWEIASFGRRNRNGRRVSKADIETLFPVAGDADHSVYIYFLRASHRSREFTAIGLDHWTAPGLVRRKSCGAIAREHRLIPSVCYGLNASAGTRLSWPRDTAGAWLESDMLHDRTVWALSLLARYVPTRFTATSLFAQQHTMKLTKFPTK